MSRVHQAGVWGRAQRQHLERQGDNQRHGGSHHGWVGYYQDIHHRLGKHTGGNKGCIQMSKLVCIDYIGTVRNFHDFQNNFLD